VSPRRIAIRIWQILPILAAVFLTPASLAAQHFPLDADIGTMLRYLVEDGETPGIVLAVIEADGSTRVNSFGSTGPNARPIGARTVFEIGSINKTFTGTLLADLVARGKVALDDPISKYLPSGVRAPSRNGREITLLDLATHHSGLPRMVDNHIPADRNNPYADYTVQTLYAFLTTHELRREPGTVGEYSNAGFGLLGHLLGRAEGTTYEALVTDRILQPLGMSTTAYSLAGDVGEWMSKGHDSTYSVVPFWFATDALHGAGGLRSNAEDMLKYVKASIGIASTDVQRAMRAAHQIQKRLSPALAIGLGWQTATSNGRAIVNHGGGTGGFNTHIGFDPEKNVGFVMLTNTGQFRDDIGMDLLSRGPSLAPPTVAVAREILERYVGTYDVGGRDMYVRLEQDGTITFQAPANVRFQMYATSDSTFYMKRAPWRVTFPRDTSGAGTALILDIDGVERRARKTGTDTPSPRIVAGNGASIRGR
jgi:CubicO group peptidase (beta-lactamase class C family)